MEGPTPRPARATDPREGNAMLFCSEQFLVFFVLVFTAYWVLPWRRVRVYLLLAASFYFYASWNKWLALIICVSTTVDYFLANGIQASKSPRARKWLLTANIVANLGLLCYFKYANFFLDSLKAALQAAGLPASWGHLQVILPIGISFYTFEAINYMVDVYRGHVRAEKNLANFMLFILFFPHLVAGPIVRARDFLPQVGRNKRWSWPRLQVGVMFFLMGLVKKLAIADRMAQFADPVFQNPWAYKSGAVWIAVIAYALQIYCDFSGYTDMAIGCAHMLGYKLAQNFNMPYIAANVSEFWRRWHISLSSWLRDYLFIPLGGSRHGRWQTYRNLLLTMTLGGLWHGANWTFMIWGLLPGLVLIFQRCFQDLSADRPRLRCWLQSRLGAAVGIGVTLLTVMLLWIFFRAQTLADALTMLHRLAIPHTGKRMPVTELYLWLLVALFIFGHGLGR